MSLICAKGTRGELHSTKEGNLLHLDGMFDGAPIGIVARYLGTADYPLITKTGAEEFSAPVFHCALPVLRGA